MNFRTNNILNNFSYVIYTLDCPITAFLICNTSLINYTVTKMNNNNDNNNNNNNNNKL